MAEKNRPCPYPQTTFDLEDSPAIPYDVPNALPLVVQELRTQYEKLPHPSLDGLENHEIRIRQLEQKNRELELKVEELKQNKPLPDDPGL